MPAAISTNTKGWNTLIRYQERDVDHDAGEWRGDDQAFEPNRPHIGVAEHQAREEEDERHAEQVNVRHPHQCRNGGAGVLLRHLLQIVVAIEVGQMRVAAVVALHAILVEQRPHRLVVDRMWRAFGRPGHDDVAVVARQHGRHRPAQRAFQARTLAAAGIGDDEIFRREHVRIAAATSGVGEIHVQQGEQIAHAEHEQRRRIKNALAVRQLRVMKVVPVQWQFTHGRVPSVTA